MQLPNTCSLLIGTVAGHVALCVDPCRQLFLLLKARLMTIRFPTWMWNRNLLLNSIFNHNLSSC